MGRFQVREGWCEAVEDAMAVGQTVLSDDASAREMICMGRKYLAWRCYEGWQRRVDAKYKAVPNVQRQEMAVGKVTERWERV